MANERSRFHDQQTGELRIDHLDIYQIKDLYQLIEEHAIISHHTMFTKKKQNKYPYSKRLREITQVPMLKPDELDLHAAVEPPPVPCKALAASAIRFLDTIPDKRPHERFNEYRELLWKTAQGRESYVGDEAFAIASNLDMQARFMERSHYIGELISLGEQARQNVIEQEVKEIYCED